MSVLINESFTNETTPLWDPVGAAAQWSTYPAVQTVSMNENDLDLQEGQILGIAQAYFSSNELTNESGGVLSGVGMDQGRNLLTVSDLVSAAPQVDLQLMPMTNGGIVIPEGDDVNISADVVTTFSQTDTSQQAWRMTCRWTLNLSSQCGFAVYFIIDDFASDTSVTGLTFNSGNPFFVSSTALQAQGDGTYNYSACMSDVYFWGGALNLDGNPIGPNRGQLFVEFHLVTTLADSTNTTLNSINYAYEIEPLAYVGGI